MTDIPKSSEFHKGAAQGGRRRVAVIGSGISGAAAAWLVAQRHDVVMFEADSRPGGHSNTVLAELDDGPIAVDTGFIVYNDRNYPHFTAMLDHLGVADEFSDMSFAVSLDDGRHEYSGNGLKGLFGQPRNLLRPGHWRMVLDILSFYRRIQDFADRHDLTDMTLSDLLVRFGCSAAFTRAHILPMAAAIWSTPLERILEFPAASFVRFFDNHGLLRLSDRPQWRTVTGGSQRYVAALNRAFVGETRLSSPVERILRGSDGVRVKVRGRDAERFDAVIVATHADQALAMLGSPTPREDALLSTFGYETNRAVLHCDPTCMPGTRRCWSSWNYLSRRDAGGEKLMLTYWMNRLQNLTCERDIFVTLNPPERPRDVLAEFDYDHPIYSRAALAAQDRFGELQGVGGIWYCGAHFGHGFHEDGLKSALGVASDFGVAAPWAHSVCGAEREAA